MNLKMDRQQLAQIIEDRKTVEEHVKYVGAYALGDRQGLILGQTCFDDPSVVSNVHLELQQRDGSHMTYSAKGNGHGGSPFFPEPISQMENPFKAKFYNQGMQMLLDAGARVPAEKRGYPEITAWKDELLERDRLTIRDVKEGEYYALIDHEHAESCKRIDILRIGPILDYDEGVFIPGVNDFLLTSSVRDPRNPRQRGSHSFYIDYVNSPSEAAIARQATGDVFIFSYGWFNNPEAAQGALNITDWGKEQYGATEGKFIPVTRDDLMFLQEHAEVRVDDLVKHFTPRFLATSTRLKNEQSRTRSLPDG
jgi:hypothetical protein